MDEIAKAQEIVRKFIEERDWGKFHSPKNISMDMVVEAAEVVEIFQWMTEEQSRNLDAKDKERVGEELADVFYALVRMAELLDIDLMEAFLDKIEKTKTKYPVEKCKGLSKKYNEL